MNLAVLGDIRQHYSFSGSKLHPKTENSPFLGQLNNLLDASAMSEPFGKIYVVTEPLESLPTLLLFFVIKHLSKFYYDPSFSTLVRRKTSYAIDGMPFVAGLWTLLKQFHPSYTRLFLSHLGQFVRATVETKTEGVDWHRNSSSAAKALLIEGLPGEITNALLFLDIFCKVGKIPQSSMSEFVPSYILATMGIWIPEPMFNHTKKKEMQELRRARRKASYDH